MISKLFFTYIKQILNAPEYTNYTVKISALSKYFVTWLLDTMKLGLNYRSRVIHKAILWQHAFFFSTPFIGTSSEIIK